MDKVTISLGLALVGCGLAGWFASLYFSRRKERETKVLANQKARTTNEKT